MVNYFKTCLFQESISRTVIFPFNAPTMELVLRYIYSGVDIIAESDDLVPEVYSVANYLQVAPLIELCENSFRAGIRPELSLELWQHALMLGKDAIAEIAKTIVLSNFKIFDNPDSVGRLSLKTMEDVMAEPFINCSGASKCKAAWTWALSQDSVTQAEIDALVRALVKSPNVESGDILIASAEEMNDCFDELRVKGRQYMWSSATKAQWIQPGGANNQIVANIMLGNESSKWLLILDERQLEKNKMTLFDFEEKKWFYITTDAVDLGHHYAISSMGSILYLSGGSQKKYFRYFNVEAKRWERLADLPFDREQHNMVTLNKNMFILGGFSPETGECREIYSWEIKNQTWKRCAEIATPVASATSTSIGGKIFLVGGNLVQNGRPERRPCDIVQCFETITGFSYNIRLPLPFKAKCYTTKVAVVGNDMHVFHNGDVYQLNEKDRAYKLCSMSNAPLKGFAVAVFGDKILLFGGENENFVTVSNMFQYDVNSNQCVMLPLVTPFQMCGFSYTKIIVPSTWDLTEAKP